MEKEVSIRFAHLSPCKKVGSGAALIWLQLILSAEQPRKFQATVKIFIYAPPPCLWVPLAIRPLSLEDSSVLPGLWIISFPLLGGSHHGSGSLKLCVCERTILVLAFPFTTGDLCEPSWVQIFLFF
jgi:hypothetical protein